MPKSMKEVERIFSHELSFIQNKDIKKFTIKALSQCPSYFYSSAGSTGGKYHPIYENCQGGLILHTRTVAWIIHELSQLDMFELNDRQKDLVIVSALLHDCKRNGENPQCKYTQFKHPLYAYDFIMNTEGYGIIPKDDVKFIAETVMSHMGQWNKRGKTELPLPKTKAQKLLFLSDFIASRKELNVLDYLTATDSKINNNTEDNISTNNCIEDYRLNFGKYTGNTIGEIFNKDNQYLVWLYKSNIEKLQKGERSFIPTEQLMLIGRLLEKNNKN